MLEKALQGLTYVPGPTLLCLSARYFLLFKIGLLYKYFGSFYITAKIQSKGTIQICDMWRIRSICFLICKIIGELLPVYYEEAIGKHR